MHVPNEVGNGEWILLPPGVDPSQVEIIHRKTGIKWHAMLGAGVLIVLAAPFWLLGVFIGLMAKGAYRGFNSVTDR
jgi:hypothetical protein